MKQSIFNYRTGKIREILEQKGACSVGFANLSKVGLPITNKYRFGICFAIRHDDEIVNQLPNDESWGKMSSSLNERAGQMYKTVQELFDKWGYNYSRVPSTTRIDKLPDPGEELP